MRTIEASEVLRRRLVRAEVVAYLEKSLGLLPDLRDPRLLADLHEVLVGAARRVDEPEEVDYR